MDTFTFEKNKGYKKKNEKYVIGRLKDNCAFDIEELVKFYVEPDIQDRNPADMLEVDPAATAVYPVFRYPVFRYLNMFCNDSKMIKDFDFHQMLILSDAGMGKTSLLLIIELFYLAGFWPDGYKCKFLKATDDDVFRRISSFPVKSRTFLLVDALDESRLSMKENSVLVKEILSASKNFFRVIISFRTQFMPKYKPGFYPVVFYLSPFEDKQVVSFITKKSKGNDLKRKQAMLLVKNMIDLQSRPLLLQYIDNFICVPVGKFYWNTYYVYSSIICQWLDREACKLNEQYPNVSTPKHYELFKACLLIAETMEVEEKRTISEYEMNKLLLTNKSIFWLERLNFCGRSLLNRNSDFSFCFGHYTIKDFLLAYGIINNATILRRVCGTELIVRFINSGIEFFRNKNEYIKSKGWRVHYCGEKICCFYSPKYKLFDHILDNDNTLPIGKMRISLKRDIVTLHNMQLIKGVASRYSPPNKENAATVKQPIFAPRKV